MTNYEKTKNNMSIEKVAIFLASEIECCDYCVSHSGDCKYNGRCIDGIKQWLNSEVNENDR